MYKRIAVAVDGSKTSDAALSEAIRLAKVMGSTILLLHVCEEMPVILEPDGMSVLLTQDLMQAIAKAGKALLQKNSATVSDAGLAAETQLLETLGGRTGSEISQAAQRWGADLLVVGTHGRKGVAHLLMGSVAEAVARTALMPVLLVRGA
jgi:nucleotide-binding universal stress UspA family protein